MKTVKKAIAMLLAVLMVGALSCTAWADQADEVTFDNLESFREDSNVTIDMEMSILGESQVMQMKMKTASDVTLDPECSFTDMSAESDGETQHSLVYSVKEDSKYVIYTSNDEGATWEKQELEENASANESIPTVDGLKMIAGYTEKFEKTGTDEIHGRKADIYEGVLTGKGLNWGGSLARTEATGYGLLYLTDAMLKDNGKSLKGATVCVSGSGNVAIYATEKATQLGAKVVTMADSTGWIYDEEGIDLDAIKEIKEVKRQRLSEYKNYRPNSQYTEGKFDWSVKCDVALPCATQNELTADDAKRLIANGCFAVAEGANMPTTLEATKLIQDAGLLFAPGKAANAGGVATSALEMSQNSQRLSWTFEEVDAKLKGIMENIYKNISTAAKKYGFEGNYVVGANIAGFEKVADAMIQQGVC